MLYRYWMSRDSKSFDKNRSLKVMNHLERVHFFEDEWENVFDLRLYVSCRSYGTVNIEKEFCAPGLILSNYFISMEFFSRMMWSSSWSLRRLIFEFFTLKLDIAISLGETNLLWKFYIFKFLLFLDTSLRTHITFHDNHVMIIILFSYFWNGTTKKFQIFRII